MGNKGHTPGPQKSLPVLETSSLTRLPSWEGKLSSTVTFSGRITATLHLFLTDNRIAEWLRTQGVGVQIPAQPLTSCKTSVKLLCFSLFCEKREIILPLCLAHNRSSVNVSSFPRYPKCRRWLTLKRGAAVSGSWGWPPPHVDFQTLPSLCPDLL